MLKANCMPIRLFYAYRMTKYVGKISLWNFKRLLRKLQKSYVGYFFCLTLYILGGAIEIRIDWNDDRERQLPAASFRCCWYGIHLSSIERNTTWTVVINRTLTRAHERRFVSVIGWQQQASIGGQMNLFLLLLLLLLVPGVLRVNAVVPIQCTYLHDTGNILLITFNFWQPSLSGTLRSSSPSTICYHSLLCGQVFSNPLNNLFRWNQSSHLSCIMHMSWTSYGNAICIYFLQVHHTKLIIVWFGTYEAYDTIVFWSLWIRMKNDSRN